MIIAFNYEEEFQDYVKTRKEQLKRGQSETIVARVAGKEITTTITKPKKNDKFRY